MVITYPARPVNGGPFDKAPPKQGQWYYEPKYNGWRALVHVPTGTMYNRKGECLSIQKEFAPALEKLKCLWIDNGSDGRLVDVPEWLDCEALERRHNIGRGTLIVLDAILPALTYAERNYALSEWLEPMNLLGHAPCRDNEIRRVSPFHSSYFNTYDASDAYHPWHALQAENTRLGCEFYEGLVAKRADSLYPIQLRNPNHEFPGWVKHRWEF